MSEVKATQINGTAFVTLDSLREIYFEESRKSAGYDTELLGAIIETVDEIAQEQAWGKKVRRAWNRW